HILDNGLKIVHQHQNSRAAYCGLIMGVGSREEQEDEAGIAHFIEHLIFKGTHKRKAYHILSRLEDVGGELNAYTTKEDTCIYASFLPKYYSRTLELISDIVFNSVFPEKEIEKEKEVVVDEINSYKDSPGELIFDDFEDLVYHNSALGRNILGEEENVREFTREKIINFISRHYQPSSMVISSVGDISFEKLVKMVEKYFGGIASEKTKIVRQEPPLYIPQKKEILMDTHQVHCIMGNRAYSYRESKRLPLSLLIDLLGGAGMNSRLNLNIREKHGLAYNIESSYTPYSDTGITTVYFGCDPSDLKRCLKLCRKEMEVLINKPLGENQLRRLKAQVKGRMLLSSENYENTMLSIGKSFLVYNKIDSIDYLCEKVEKI
ncbi:MAG: insulinase family protein, partial [Odoribacter sp.]|nr:insulinase family protein [Odoribacter sp.]